MPTLHFTPEQLSSVGYKTTGSSSSVPVFTPEQLASVGYVRPAEAKNISDVAAGLVGGFMGEASDLIGTGVKNVGSLIGSEGLQEYGQGRIDNAKYFRDVGNRASTAATKAGGIGADVLGALALPAAGPLSMGLSGAAAGLATSRGETAGEIGLDVVKGAALASGLGAVIKVATPLIAKGGSLAAKLATPVKNIIEGSKVVFKNSDDWATSALDSTLKKVGGDLSKATPDQVVDSIQGLTNKLKSQATDLYTIRDTLADSAGLAVSKSNLNKLYAELKADVTTGATTEVRQSLSMLKNIIGTVDTPVSFVKADRLRSQLGSSIKSAVVKGDGAAAIQLGKVRDALDMDIANAAKGSEDVLTAQKAATDFYRDSYSPIKGLDVKNQIANKVTERVFVSNLVKNISNKQAQSKGFTALPDEIKHQVLGAAQLAIKESSTIGGKLDLAKMSSSINKSIQENPALYRATNSLEDIKTLADVVRSPAIGRPGLKQMVSTGIISGGFGFAGGGGLGFIGSAAVSEAVFLHAAGKLLNNKAAQDLLRSMRGLEAYPDSAMAAAVKSKIGFLYMNQFKTLSKKALAVMLGAG